ncbi:MAG: DNA alkylation repair protein [Cystobacterineae bacterium]|nr:DNA alkylation repair protein [Cystobacterineae bacterium]
MKYDKIFAELEKHKDDKQAEKMSAYMRNIFPFLGIPKPKLKELEKLFFKEFKKADLDWDFVNACWEKDYREAQYVALDYLRTKIKKLTKDDLPKLQKLIVRKSWWETIDTLDAFVGSIVLKHPELEKEMLVWSQSENIWLRRTAIDFQQGYKDKTRVELLEKIIVNNLGSKEFFINKAIGWSLREYSKTNPSWVRSFLKKHGNELNKLSVKEAGKYL